MSDMTVEKAQALLERQLTPAEPLAEVQRWKAALDSIARNTCCDGCQEAALVARAALGDAG